MDNGSGLRMFCMTPSDHGRHALSCYIGTVSMMNAGTLSATQFTPELVPFALLLQDPGCVRIPIGERATVSRTSSARLVAAASHGWQF